MPNIRQIAQKGELAIVVLAVVVLAVGFARQRNDNTTSYSPPATSTKAATITTSGSKAASSSLPPQAATTNTSQTTSIGSSQASPACKVLTTTVAQETLGSAATSDPANNGPASGTSDDEIDVCTYTSSNNSQVISVTAYTAKTQLGASTNDLAFGSERPNDATSVSGLGQSAYWDASSGQLDVLASNNRYIITWTTGNPAKSVAFQDVKSLAERMAASF